MTSPDENNPRSSLWTYHTTPLFKTRSVIARWKVCSVSGVFCGGIALGSSPLFSSDQSCFGLISQKPLKDPVSLLAAGRSFVLVSQRCCVGVDLDCSALQPQSRSPPQGPFHGSPLRSLQSWATEDSFIVRPKERKQSSYIVFLLYNDFYPVTPRLGLSGSWKWMNELVHWWFLVCIIRFHLIIIFYF